MRSASRPSLRYEISSAVRAMTSSSSGKRLVGAELDVVTASRLRYRSPTPLDEVGRPLAEIRRPTGTAGASGSGSGSGARRAGAGGRSWRRSRRRRCRHLFVRRRPRRRSQPRGSRMSSKANPRADENLPVSDFMSPTSRSAFETQGVPAPVRTHLCVPTLTHLTRHLPAVIGAAARRRDAARGEARCPIRSAPPSRSRASVAVKSAPP